MKRNLLRTVMEWALVMSLILSSYFFIRFYFQSRDLRSLNPQLQNEAMQNQSARQFRSTLANEIAEYSKRDPAVIPMLETIGVRLAKPAAPVAPKPAGK